MLAAGGRQLGGSAGHGRLATLHEESPSCSASWVEKMDQITIISIFEAEDSAFSLTLNLKVFSRYFQQKQLGYRDIFFKQKHQKGHRKTQRFFVPFTSLRWSPKWPRSSSRSSVRRIPRRSHAGHKENSGRTSLISWYHRYHLMLGDNLDDICMNLVSLTLCLRHLQKSNFFKPWSFFCIHLLAQASFFRFQHLVRRERQEWLSPIAYSLTPRSFPGSAQKHTKIDGVETSEVVVVHS